MKLVLAGFVPVPAHFPHTDGFSNEEIASYALGRRSLAQLIGFGTEKNSSLGKRDNRLLLSRSRDVRPQGERLSTNV